MIHQRQVYRQSPAFGQTVHDLTGKAAKAAVSEVEALKREVLQLLGLKGKGGRKRG